MSVGFYSEGDNQFLSEMGGVDSLIVGFPVSGTWGFHPSN